MTVNYSCTFEFETAPPLTTTGTVRASTMPTCFARAARAAVKAHPGVKWTSMVCVLLERVEEAARPIRAKRKPVEVEGVAV